MPNIQKSSDGNRALASVQPRHRVLTVRINAFVYNSESNPHNRLLDCNNSRNNRSVLLATTALVIYLYYDFFFFLYYLIVRIGRG